MVDNLLAHPTEDALPPEWWWCDEVDILVWDTREGSDEPSDGSLVIVCLEPPMRVVCA